MRILFISNLYPPHEPGGQGYSCQQVVMGMQARGHNTLVLTSMHGTNNVPLYDGDVHRRLFLEMDLVPRVAAANFFTRRKLRERNNLHVLKQTVEKFNPDVIFIWGMWNVNRAVPALAEKLLPGCVLYRFADYWPILSTQHEHYWRAPGQSSRAHLFKKVLGKLALYMLTREAPPPELRYEHAICVSRAVRDVLVNAGVPIADARIIYTGIEISPYTRQAPRKQSKNSLRLIYAGRLSAEKGVETSIQALAKILSYKETDVHLTLAGKGESSYQVYLKSLAIELGVEKNVTFLGFVPKEKMPALLQEQDVLLLPSVWEEPFSRIVLEGMSAELVIVATPNGGTKEIVQHETNGLLFRAGDADDLANQVERLIADPALSEELSQRGRCTVMKQFTNRNMMDAFEAVLQEVASCMPVLQNEQGVY